MERKSVPQILEIAAIDEVEKDPGDLCMGLEQV
jgi:hypothetical protein